MQDIETRNDVQLAAMVTGENPRQFVENAIDRRVVEVIQQGPPRVVEVDAGERDDDPEPDQPEQTPALNPGMTEDDRIAASILEFLRKLPKSQKRVTAFEIAKGAEFRPEGQSKGRAVGMASFLRRMGVPQFRPEQNGAPGFYLVHGPDGVKEYLTPCS